MPLHIVKLCVGCDSVEDLKDWIAFRLEEARSLGREAEYGHVTRMVPKRVDELLDGGSLYWVMKGHIRCRQRILAVRPFIDAQGIRRCKLVLDPLVVETERQPRRAFQGWRYLEGKDVPADLGHGGKAPLGLPADLRRQLADLGLL